ncbi:radical SAM-linked protein [Microlunatus soli]|uniref:Radical SAM-linked protein n=1 Tax=Microlunatus soli TaxID=630515 RepID=A0A1H1YAK1_9ACTN|nr:radical SAM-linked protein [Microlunatus soli]
MQRLRIRYAKRGRLRFTSHRDFGRAFERALRRAGIPMAYSSGFSPHPRISYSTASPTGAASEAEYLEIALAQVCVPELVKSELDRALPPGLDVLGVVESDGSSLADRLTGSAWRIELPGVAPDVISAAVTTFLAADSAPAERMTKNGLRTFDARESVLRLVADDQGMELVTRHLTPLVRPDDVLGAMTRLLPAFAPSQPLITRLRQGEVNHTTGDIVEPF